MNKTTCILLSLLTSAAQAQQVKWNADLPSHDLIDFTRKSIQAPQPVNTEKTPLQFSYALTDKLDLSFANEGYTDSSRQYWLDVESQALLDGIDLPVTHESAVVRISPLLQASDKRAVEFTAANVELTLNGLTVKPQVFADSESLKATGAPFADATVAFKVNTRPGVLKVKVNGAANDATPYVVHVLEPQSKIALDMGSQKALYHANETLVIDSTLHTAVGTAQASLTGYISKPDGSVHSHLKFVANGQGGYTASVPLPDGVSQADGLWGIHTFAQSEVNGDKVLRDAHSSFSVELNSARFNGRLEWQDNRLEVGITNALEGRYEVKGILYGVDADGAAQPFAVTMSAAWLKVGEQAISLDVRQKLLQDSGLSAPFELRNVQLVNQSLISPVQTVLAGIALGQ